MPGFLLKSAQPSPDLGRELRIHVPIPAIASRLELQLLFA